MHDAEIWLPNVQDNLLGPISKKASCYNRRLQPTARVPSVARGTIFNGSPSEMKYSNYDLLKNGIFN
jgi:hypothetical protein